MKRKIFAVLIFLCVTVLSYQSGHTINIQRANTIELISLASDGTPGDAPSWHPSVSANGRYIAFTSRAGNLVSGDTGEIDDVFVHDRFTEETTRVSISSNGTQGNDLSYVPSISENGQYVVFASRASSFDSNDTNDEMDIFVHDRQSGETERVSVSSTGIQGDGTSGRPAISANGRYVVFTSIAENLVGSDDTNGVEDVFVHDRNTGQTTLVSRTPTGESGNNESTFPSISGDGQLIVFQSTATNLTTTADTNNTWDIFIYNQKTEETIMVSIATDNNAGNNESTIPFITRNGRYISFESKASNLLDTNIDTNEYADIFVYDSSTNAIVRVSVTSDGMEATGNSGGASISDDGNYVAFWSWASNLTNYSTDRNQAYVHNQETGITTLISKTPDGVPGDRDSFWSQTSISADGSIIAFNSSSRDLGPTLNPSSLYNIFGYEQIIQKRIFLPMIMREN